MKNPARKAIGPLCGLTFGAKNFWGHTVRFFWKIVSMRLYEFLIIRIDAILHGWREFRA